MSNPKTIGERAKKAANEVFLDTEGKYIINRPHAYWKEIPDSVTLSRKELMDIIQSAIDAELAQQPILHPELGHRLDPKTELVQQPHPYNPPKHDTWCQTCGMELEENETHVPFLAQQPNLITGETGCLHKPLGPQQPSADEIIQALFEADVLQPFKMEKARLIVEDIWGRPVKPSEEPLRETKTLEKIAEEVRREHLCECEVCSHSAAICPATASSLIMEIAELRASVALPNKD
jgi:hypothetical protein